MEDITKSNLNIYNDIRFLKGVGDVKAGIFSKIGIYTIKDLIEYYPRVYEDRTTLRKIAEFTVGENVLFTAKIISKVSIMKTRNRISIHKVYVSDGTRNLFNGLVQSVILKRFFQRRYRVCVLWKSIFR